MSAPAVEAVRDGFRIAFCRASEPAEPPRRAPGAPSTDASGRISFGAIVETPLKNSRTPAARDAISAGVESPPAVVP